MYYKCDRHEVGGQYIIGDGARVEVGDIIAYRGHKYRVTGFVKLIEHHCWSQEFCTWDECTHVTGYGVSGCTVPLDEVVIIGTLKGDWSDERVQELKDQAARLAEDHARV
jgi:hypothetical protein